jgi:hypothetical protein
MKQFIVDNARWIFSGIGVFLLAGAVRLFFGWRARHEPRYRSDAVIQGISAGHASTNIQTGNASTVLVTTTQSAKVMAGHGTRPIRVDSDGAVIHKTTILEGDYQEFIWGFSTVRISVSEILKSTFYSSSLMSEKEALGALISFSTGGGLVFGGVECKRTGVNEYLIPQKEFHDEEPCSVYAYYVGDGYFSFIRVFVDHINQHSRQVTLNMAFVQLRNVKTM